MARIPELEPLYQAFRRFLDLCIVEDRSLIWADTQTWTLANVAEVKKRLVDTPMFGRGRSFEQKLLEQMREAAPEHWCIICDTYYVYFLPSSFIKLDKRREALQWAAQQAGLALPSEASFWKPQTRGFTRTSIKYHSKYSQFWLVLLFALQVKQAEDRQAMVRDPQRMQATLDSILESISNKNDRGYDMRHAMLHLAFPDQYEPIISTRDKNRIIEVFGPKVPGPLPEDADAKLRAIREALGRTYNKPDRPFNYYTNLKDEWRPSSAGTEEDEGDERPREPDDRPPTRRPDSADRDIARILDALGHTRNVILYGPPGTGKTYLARKAGEALVQAQIEEPLSPQAAIAKAVEALTLHEIIALSMYEADPAGHYSVPDIAARDAVAMRLPAPRVQYPKNTIWSVLLSHTHPDSLTVKASVRWQPYLFDKDAESRWFLTDGGREYVEQNLAGELAMLRPAERPKASVDDFVTWVTFHQSYSYEDFVEGLRPLPSAESQEGITYDVVPGAFRRICERAAKDRQNRYVLAIDEINRGNIAKILGELITLIEDDKRGGEANALSVTLPYSGELFSVPGNLYIIGTMNSTDRSIALLDVALRRRFAFIELMPRAELLAGIKIESEESVLDLQALLRSLNSRIRRYLDRDHQIGHSYLLRVGETAGDKRVDALEFVWNHQILPMLEEFFYTQRDQLADLLSPLRPDVPVASEADEDGKAGFELGWLAGEDLVAALAKLAEEPLP